MFDPALVTFLYPYKPHAAGLYMTLVVEAMPCDIYIVPTNKDGTSYNITLSKGGSSLDEISRDIDGVENTINALKGLFAFLGV